MTTLAERLAGKARRRAVVPVAVTDPTEAAAAVEKARNRYVGGQAVWGDEDERTLQRKEELDAAEATLAECYENVEFQACAPRDFERIQRATFPAGKEAEPEQIDEAIPELAALCAVDESVQDPAWWAEQLESGNWASGEKFAVWVALLRVNSNVSDGRVPFG